MSEAINEKGSEKVSNWKKLIHELFESNEERISTSYNEALEDYKKYLEGKKEEYQKEYESIDRLFDTDLLRYIAKVLCTIKYKL